MSRVCAHRELVGLFTPEDGYTKRSVVTVGPLAGAVRLRLLTWIVLAVGFEHPADGANGYPEGHGYKSLRCAFVSHPQNVSIFAAWRTPSEPASGACSRNALPMEPGMFYSAKVSLVCALMTYVAEPDG